MAESAKGLIRGNSECLENSCYSFFKTAEDLGTALFVHPWDMQLGGRYSKYWLPWLVGKFHTKYSFEVSK